MHSWLSWALRWSRFPASVTTHTSRTRSYPPACSTRICDRLLAAAAHRRVPQEPAGRNADDELEVAGEVRLVVEARLCRGERDRLSGEQKVFGMPDAKLGLIGVRRHSRRFPEDAAQVEGAQPGYLGQFAQRDVMCHVFGQVLHAAADRLRFAAWSSGFAGRSGVAAGEQGEGARQLGFAFEHAGPG